MNRHRRACAGAACAFCLIGVLSAGCTAGDTGTTDPAGSSGAAAESVLLPPDGRRLSPVTMPDYALMTEPVAQQMRTHHTAVRVRLDDPPTEPAALGDAYGRLGILLLAAT